MKQDEYIETQTAKGIVWKLKQKGDFEDVQTIEDDAQGSDVVLMFLFLAAMVLIDSVVCGALLAGLLRTIVLKAQPYVDRQWLGNEIEVIFVMTFVMVTFAQIAAILVGARIGRLVAKHGQ